MSVKEHGGYFGTLMVEDVDTNPPAVGFFYAGRSVEAIANPISKVWSFLGATMVGS